jgi:Flp pilus assembly protein TadD
VALGLVGTMKANDALSRSLGDADPLVRRLAHTALWSIWFRADTPENNAELQQIAGRIARDQYKEAEDQATRLIARSPKFAEAYNQRAIAEFFQGRYADSARDCRRVLELNPVHTGALSGLGQCYVRMGQRRQALEVYRRALELEPHNDALRDLVAELSVADA